MPFYLIRILAENFTDGGTANVSAVHAAGKLTEIHRAGQPRSIPRQLESQVNTVYNAIMHLVHAILTCDLKHVFIYIMCKLVY